MDLKRVRVGCTALLCCGLAVAASAQQVDVDRLPVDLARIQRQLQQAAARDESNGLNIRYVIDVYGRAPRIEFFTKEDNLANGPVPYGGPTHREILQVITPPEFRAPVMDFNALLRWLADKANQKK